MQKNTENLMGMMESGEQHYKYVAKFYHSRAEFMAAQERDRRKISYCLANNIPIYVIPYWELENLTL